MAQADSSVDEIDSGDDSIEDNHRVGNGNNINDYQHKYVLVCTTKDTFFLGYLLLLRNETMWPCSHAKKVPLVGTFTIIYDVI